MCVKKRRLDPFRPARAARAGRKGSSLLFLAPKEEAYVDLLKMRKVPLEPLPTTELCCPPLPDDEDDNNDGGKGTKAKLQSKPSDDNQEPAKKILKSAADPDRQLEDVLSKVRDMVLKDRDMLEKGTKAFTSYIRAYKEHQCAFLFR